jgi:hypothetical protein
MRLVELRVVSGVAAAAPILQRKVYGWFGRVSRVTYGLTVVGAPLARRRLCEPAPRSRVAAGRGVRRPDCLG